MSREILFKAKQIDNEEWIEGYLFATQDHIYIAYPDQFDDDLFLATERIFLAVNRKTVCQYTGMKDKNGRKIFEGDIVRCGGILVVTWNEKFSGWCLTKEGWLYNHFFGESCEPRDCEVIGNIFDNPELLEGQVNNE